MRLRVVLAPLVLAAAPARLPAQAAQSAPVLHHGDPVEVLAPRFGSGWLPATIHMVGECPMVTVKPDPANRYVAPNRPKQVRAHALVTLKGLRIRSSGTDSTWITLSEDDLQRYGACPTP
ncbi:MAG TPA: hypothetical protein VNJ71_09080 [Gemmatimonadales bacterium]|nr:hypothetical protein [Gemmatimonadales bacterium]